MRLQPAEEFLNKRYHRLLITHDMGFNKVLAKRRILAICDCGDIREYSLGNLKNGSTKSCGCHLNDLCVERLTKHGLRYHPLYTIWRNIKRRCYKETSKRYADYGGRGIKMCEEWKNSVVVFYDWCISNGWEQGLDMDRENNDGDYDPGNCRFVTRKVGNSNKRSNIWIEYNGRKMIASDWARELGLNYGVITRRLKKGYPIHEVLYTGNFMGKKSRK